VRIAIFVIRTLCIQMDEGFYAGMEAISPVFLAKLRFAEQSLTRSSIDVIRGARKNRKKIRRPGGGCVEKADVTEEEAIAIPVPSSEWKIRTANEIIIDSARKLLDLQLRKHGWAHLM